MPVSMTVPAPAKVNLHLAVGGLRNDGYHELRSLFQAVSLADDVGVAIVDAPGVRLACDVACPPERNTMFRAATAFLGAAGGTVARAGLRIETVKRIPEGAGLGGGSSDAAAVLKVLDRLFPGAVDAPTMAALALSIGSDVPFFLGAACAAVSGRGEILSPMPSRTGYGMVIVHPGFPVSTAAAYRELDLSREAAPSADMDRPGLDELAAAHATLPPARWPFRNDFYAPVAASRPVLAGVLDGLRDLGAAFAAMSGSGSALFGVFDDPGAAEPAADAMRAGGLAAWAAFPLARLPEGH